MQLLVVWLSHHHTTTLNTPHYHYHTSHNYTTTHNHTQPRPHNHFVSFSSAMHTRLMNGPFTLGLPLGTLTALSQSLTQLTKTCTSTISCVAVSLASVANRTRTFDSAVSFCFSTKNNRYIYFNSCKCISLIITKQCFVLCVNTLACMHADCEDDCSWRQEQGEVFSEAREPEPVVDGQRHGPWDRENPFEQDCEKWGSPQG